MWSPLPQILEQCLHEVYRDRGWDTVTNTNVRLPQGAEPASAFPTMTELAQKVDIYTSTLGYDDRVRADLRAALLTRVKGLRIGGKGAMFDCGRSFPMKYLLEQPVILELQNLGDDDDKAFFMALLFIRLVEFRRAYGVTQNGLRHLLVIEEAHRLLTNATRSASQEQADPKGKAVETFANLISEIRAYGQGLAVIDQVPTKLAPDVIKNTNLKIAHRIVADDDRTLLAGAMAMNEEQRAALAILGVGKAAVFEEGEDAPLLLAIPPAKDTADDQLPDDKQLKRRMESCGQAAAWTALLRSYQTCQGTCTASQADCRRAADAAEDALIRRTFTKIVVSALGDPTSVIRLRSDLEAAVAIRRPRVLNNLGIWTCFFTHLSASLSYQWGTRQAWTFPQTAGFGELLRRAMINGALKGDLQPVRQFAAEGGQLMSESAVPCTACEASRTHLRDPSICLFRPAVESLIEERLFHQEFSKARSEDEAQNDAKGTHSLAVCNNAAFELIEFPSPALADADRTLVVERARRCLLCFSYHMLAKNYDRAPWVVTSQFNRIMSNWMPEAEGGAPSARARSP